MNIASPRPSRKQQPRAIEDQTNDRKRSVTTTSASLSTNTLVPRRSTPALRVLATASVVPRVAREVSDVIIELFASHQIEARGPSTPSTRNWEDGQGASEPPGGQFHVRAPPGQV